MFQHVQNTATPFCLEHSIAMVLTHVGIEILIRKNSFNLKKFKSSIKGWQRWFVYRQAGPKWWRASLRLLTASQPLHHSPSQSGVCLPACLPAVPAAPIDLMSGFHAFPPRDAHLDWLGKKDLCVESTQWRHAWLRGGSQVCLCFGSTWPACALRACNGGWVL